MDDRSAVDAKKVRILKGKALVVDDVSFTMRRGTVTGLIGPSGSGKTTLMRAIVGTQQVSSGKLEVLGRPAGSAELRASIGYVTQQPAVYDDLTVYQNVAYFAALVGTSRAQVNEVIHQVDLADQSSQLVASLSGGQRARVSLAVALLGEPELLVLDEPTVGLDPILREELWSLFAELAAKGTALLISSHVMDEAEKCEDLLLLRQGKLLWHDSRQELLERTKTPNVQEAFMAAIEEIKP